MKKNLIAVSLINSLGVIVYVLLVAAIMQNGEKLFGKMTNFWGPFAFLMLFVLSASIVGLLTLGKPIMLYLNGEKKEAAQMLFYTVLWLFIATFITLVLHAIY